jgi:hypothetical protein
MAHELDGSGKPFLGHGPFQKMKITVLTLVGIIERKGRFKKVPGIYWVFSEVCFHKPTYHGFVVIAIDNNRMTPRPYGLPDKL